jgi:hypothetical protein
MSRGLITNAGYRQATRRLCYRSDHRPVGLSRRAAHDTCSRFPHIAALRESWGDHALQMAEAYLGSGARTRRFLAKLLEGQPVVGRAETLG